MLSSNALLFIIEDGDSMMKVLVLISQERDTLREAQCLAAFLLLPGLIRYYMEKD
jgi:hypothetical protein